MPRHTNAYPRLNKLGAMQLLAKMCGWNEPEKHEFEHGFKER